MSADTAGRFAGMPNLNVPSPLSSGQPSACHTFAHVSTFAARNPTVSSDGAKGRTPSLGSTPNVGLKPMTPQNDAGRTIDPSVCGPRARGTTPAATAAADPLELPPGVCAKLRGLRVGGGSKYA